MRKYITILSLIITLFLGSTSMLVIPNTAEASLFGSILKAIFGESDTIAKGGVKSIDNLGVGKSTDKIVVDEYTHIGTQYFTRGIRTTLREKYKCHSKQWAISLVQNTNIYSEPILNSKIVGEIEKDEKVCVVKEEGEWVEIFFGWVESKQIKKL